MNLYTIIYSSGRLKQYCPPLTKIILTATYVGSCMAESSKAVRSIFCFASATPCFATRQSHTKHGVAGVTGVAIDPAKPYKVGCVPVDYVDYLVRYVRRLRWRGLKQAN